MLSKFSRVLLSYPLNHNVSSTAAILKSINKYTNFRIAERKFHLNSYELQKIAPKPNTKTQKPVDVSAQSIGYYSMAVVVLCAGLTFAAVPLYRLFCQVKNVRFNPFQTTKNQ